MKRRIVEVIDLVSSSDSESESSSSSSSFFFDDEEAEVDFFNLDGELLDFLQVLAELEAIPPPAIPPPPAAALPAIPPPPAAIPSPAAAAPSCQVCYHELATVPVEVLPCYHVFCTDCMSNWHGPCPTCRAPRV